MNLSVNAKRKIKTNLLFEHTSQKISHRVGFRSEAQCRRKQQRSEVQLHIAAHNPVRQSDCASWVRIWIDEAIDAKAAIVSRGRAHERNVPFHPHHVARLYKQQRASMRLERAIQLASSTAASNGRLRIYR